MSTDTIQVLALYVIKQGDTFLNTYGLCKVLTRAFEVSNCMEVITLLNSNGFVDSREMNGINCYHITSKGENFMKAKHHETVEFLIIKFPKNAELVNALMKI